MDRRRVMRDGVSRSEFNRYRIDRLRIETDQSLTEAEHSARRVWHDPLQVRTASVPQAGIRAINRLEGDP